MADKKATEVAETEMLFGKRQYTIMLVGVLVMALGYFLMTGGHMPDSNTWDEDIIYGFRRTVLAPILILAGLGIEIYAIFKK